MTDDFLYRDVPAFGRKVFRLGLATNYGVDGKDLEWALEQGVNYVFWTPNARKVTGSLKRALKRDRESIVLACGPTTAYFGGSVRRTCERFLKKLGTDYIDVFQLFWLGRTSAWTSSTISALTSLRESGMVRAIGASMHDRKRAGKLAADSPLDILDDPLQRRSSGCRKGHLPLSRQKAAGDCCVHGHSVGRPAQATEGMEGTCDERRGLLSVLSFQPTCGSGADRP